MQAAKAPAVAPQLRGGSVAMRSVPPALRPLVRAYLLGYASAVAPRLLTAIVQYVTRRRRNAEKLMPTDEADEPSLLKSTLYILKTGFDPQRFPTFCAVLVGGSTLLQKPVERLLARLSANSATASRLRLSRWLSTFVAALLGLKLLHTKGTAPRRYSSASRDRFNKARSMKLAGRTMDLTLFAVTRALDVLVGEMWSQRRARRQAAQKWTKVESFVQYMADPLVFVTSCAFIMWSWFYYPDRLPRGYQKWIMSAASVDNRLIEALRRFHHGHLLYGKETGQAGLLGDMCDDYQLPRHWGNPVETIPLPCDIVHMGCGPSCEYHALSRFVRSWKWSMFTYLPLALALQIRKKPSRHSLVHALLSASRSSAFLATYITLFYYGVCLARSRIGPVIVGTDVKARQKLDSGICVGTGCALCGWSVLVETVSRRKDMGLFVAPRALSTVVPRQYPVEKQWRETLAFAASTAVVFTCVMENPKRVRGVLGGVLGFVLRR